MPNNWSYNLWDCREDLEKYFDYSSQNMIILSNYLKRVSELNRSHYEKMIKLYKEIVQCLPIVDYFGEDYQNQTFSNLFDVLFIEHITIANQSDYSAEICLKASNDLRNHAAVLIESKNKILTEFSKIEASLKKTISEYDKKKMSVISTFDKKGDKKLKNSKSLSLTSIPLSMDKIPVSQDMDGIKSALEENRSRICVFLEKFFKKEMETKLDMLEDMNRVICKKTLEILTEYLDNCKNRCFRTVNESLDKMIKTLKDTTPENENAIVALSFCTGLKFQENPDLLIKELENISKYKSTKLKKSNAIDKSSRTNSNA